MGQRGALGGGTGSRGDARCPGRRASRCFAVLLVVASIAGGATGVPLVASAAGGATSVSCPEAPPVTSSDDRIDVLAFTHTAGYRHDSIPVALDWFATLGPDGIDVTPTEDPATFTADVLGGYDVVVFANTTGDVLDADQQAALEGWVEAGGGFVGVHSAADTEHDWPWYGDELVGTSFTSHPAGLQTVVLTTEATDDPTVAHFPRTWTYTDEFYNFDRNPRPASDVLLVLDEASATFAADGTPVGDAFTHGTDHPVAWSHSVGAGRSFYTNLGHLATTWQNPDVLTHFQEAIRWAAVDQGVSPDAGCGTT